MESTLGLAMTILLKVPTLLLLRLGHLLLQRQIHSMEHHSITPLKLSASIPLLILEIYLLQQLVQPLWVWIQEELVQFISAQQVQLQKYLEIRLLTQPTLLTALAPLLHQPVQIHSAAIQRLLQAKTSQLHPEYCLRRTRLQPTMTVDRYFLSPTIMQQQV